LKPGNAGGGKGPDFWYVSEEDKDEAIDDESSNTLNDQATSDGTLL
jgi:hypothetical protein